MNRGKVVSGFVALAIYLGLIFTVLFFYNIHKTKAKNYVEKNADRVTVTLVNSDKTVFNKSSKISTPKIPTPIIVPPVPLKRATPKPKKHVPQRVIKPKPKPKKHVAKRVIKPKPKPKKHVAKRVIKPKPKPKKHVPKRVIKPKPKPKHVPKKVIKPKPKPKHVPKKVIKPKPKPKHVPKKVIKPKPKHVPKKTAKDLFSSVKTKDVTKRPVKRRPKPVFVPHKAPSSIKHNSSISDRIKNTHQSGRTSNSNRDRGIKNGYISKVKRHLNNWNADAVHKGKRVTLKLTIYSSGKFSYTILSGGNSSMRSSLSSFLDRLNRMGQLGGHSKASPYSIKVNFTVR